MTKVGLVPVRMLALLVAVAASGVFLGSDEALAHNFDACASGAPVDKTPNTVSDIQGVFGIGLGPNCKGDAGAGDDVVSYNSGGLVTVTPPEWGVAADADIPDGTAVGTFSSVAQLGLLNNACNTVVPVNFDLMDATTNTSKTISAKPPGQPNRLEPLAQDNNGDGVPDGADSWPTFLTDQGAKSGWTLSDISARFVGFNDKKAVPGLTIVLNFIVFKPGSHVSDLINIDPLLGYPAVTVLNDPTAAASNQDAPSDFCGPLSTSATLKGTAGAKNFRKNPGDGTYNFVTIVASQPDADEDGIENSLDPCNPRPQAPGANTNDSAWNPRGASGPGTGETDSDGIPDSCDPNPNVKSVGGAGTGIANADEDGDLWQNRGDNCPLDPNPDQVDVEPDGIGDACDPDPAARTGHFHLECKVTEVVIGVGGAAKVNPQDVQPCNPGAPFPFTTGGTPTPTLPPGATPRPIGVGGGTGGPAPGIGSLSPVGTGVPAWAALITTLGVIGVLGGAGLAGSRMLRRRD